MFLIAILFIETFRCSLMFRLVECLLLNFITKAKLSKKFHKKL